jgi:hypothetical protein
LYYFTLDPYIIFLLIFSPVEKGVKGKYVESFPSIEGRVKIHHGPPSGLTQSFHLKFYLTYILIDIIIKRCRLLLAIQQFKIL